MPSVLSLSAKGASFLILIQVGSRALTFTINQLLLRYLSPELLGISTQLELYTISVLYFSRESLRVALQRPTSNTQAAVNVAYIPIALSVLLSGFIGVLYAQSSSLPNVPSIRQALVICGLATVIEVLSEPCFAVVQQKLLYGKRAAAEASGAVLRCIITYAAVVWCHDKYGNVGALPFAWGLLGYALTLSVVYFAQMMSVAKQNNFSLLLKRVPEQANQPHQFIASYFSRELCTLGLNLYLQSGVKYILTQGDSLLITSLSTLHDQGTYALATNYGGLIARVIFQPIEESSRNLFAKLCAPSASSLQEAHNKGDGTILSPKSQRSASATVGRENGEATDDKQSIKQAASILTTILHLYSIVSLVAWSIGPPLAPHLLRLVAGPKWASTSASEVLGTYTYYIPIMAINGVTEAFVSAVATNAQLRQQSTFLALNFLIFALSAFQFVRRMHMGATGLVWACCVGLGCRCAWNGLFIKKFFANKGAPFHVWDAAPNMFSVGLAVGVGAILGSGSYLHPMLQGPMGSIGVSAAFGMALLASEGWFLMECYHMLVHSGREGTAASPSK